MPQISDLHAEIATANHLTQVLVHVRDSNGATGTGEAWWGIPDSKRPGANARPIASVVDDLLAPQLIGADPAHIERHAHALWDWGYRYADVGIYTMGLSGVDLALWDLAGKTQGRSAVDMMGGPVHERLPVYASFPPLRDVSRVIAETERALQAGISAIKLHELEARYVVELRERFGDALTISVDVNGHFDLLDAIALGRELAALDVIWYEEPVRPMRDRRAIAEVARATGIDLAAGENEYALQDFQALLDANAIRYLQPELTKCGGLTAARRIGTLAELAGVALCPHNFRSGPSLAASIGWAFASPSARWIELPWLPEGVEFAGRFDLPALVDGCVLPPTAPGLGWQRR